MPKLKKKAFLSEIKIHIEYTIHEVIQKELICSQIYSILWWIVTYYMNMYAIMKISVDEMARIYFYEFGISLDVEGNKMHFYRRGDEI